MDRDYWLQTHQFYKDTFYDDMCIVCYFDWWQAFGAFSHQSGKFNLCGG